MKKAGRKGKIIALLVLIFIASVSFYYLMQLNTEENDYSTTESDASEVTSNAKLSDFWLKEAYFGTEERLGFSGVPYNSELDFYYNVHDSGMALIEDPSEPGVVYYFAEHWKSGFDNLEPVLYKSTDGGLTFELQTVIFNVHSKNCTSVNTDYAYWEVDHNGNGNIEPNEQYCIFQLREPDVIYHEGHYYVVFEAWARNPEKGVVGGIALAKFSDLNFSQPQQIRFQENFRKHPLLFSYDGTPDTPGIQETSTSTPFFAVTPERGVYVFWVGIYPLGDNWQRVDTYRGHFSSSPGSSNADCTDLMHCYFTPDEQFISNPNLGINPQNQWESKNIDGMSVIKEGDYYYMLYHGYDDAEPSIARYAGVNIVRSRDLINWERFTDSFDELIFTFDTLRDGVKPGPGVYGKLVKTQEGYFYYFFRRGLPAASNGNWPARLYRRKLISGNCVPDCDGRQCGSDGCGGVCGVCESDLICDVVGNCISPPDLDVNIDLNVDGEVNMMDYHIFITDYLKFKRQGIIEQRSNLSGGEAINMVDYQIFIREYLRLKRGQ